MILDIVVAAHVLLFGRGSHIPTKSRGSWSASYLDCIYISIQPTGFWRGLVYGAK